MDLAPDLTELGFCPFARIINQPCPLCGGTRAVTSLVRGDVTAALRMNAVVAVGVVLIVVWCATTVRSSGLAGIRARLGVLVAPPIDSRRVNRRIVVTLLAWWCWNLARW